MSKITRRVAILTGVGAAGYLITQKDALTTSPTMQRIFRGVERWTEMNQRLLMGQRLAREFTVADLSPVFKANGTSNPGGPEYERHVEENFANWRLRITGLVQRPMALSLADLKLLPSRTQITRHDCVEGWSAIGQWKGTPLGLLLQSAGILPNAKYAVFYCADNLEYEPSPGGILAPGQYYESIALTDCFHPQTIMAYEMNGKPLGVPHGAPLRLRVERMLGYKHAKYVHSIELVESFAHLGQGHGGYWEDYGYEWYAGI